MRLPRQPSPPVPFRRVRRAPLRLLFLAPSSPPGELSIAEFLDHVNAPAAPPIAALAPAPDESPHGVLTPPPHIPLPPVARLPVRDLRPSVFHIARIRLKHHENETWAWRLSRAQIGARLCARAAAASRCQNVAVAERTFRDACEADGRSVAAWQGYAGILVEQPQLQS